MNTLHHYNTRIPQSALVDLSRPERPPVSPTPVLCPPGSVALFIVLTGDYSLPILLTAQEITELGGAVPEVGDLLAADTGRKFWIGKRCLELRLDDNRREFVSC